MKKRIAKIAALLLVPMTTAVGTLAFLGKQMFIFSINQDNSSSLMNKLGSPNPSDREEAQDAEEAFRKHYEEVSQNGYRWLMDQHPEEITIESYDGLKLFGWLLPNIGADGRVSNKTMLLMHGYRCDGQTDLAHTYKYFYDKGFNLMVPNQRSHGRSEGEYICYGTKERFDVKKWCEFLVERFGKDQEIDLMGISMGSATVLMSTGLALPEQVNKVIADCGFTSPQAEFEVCMQGYNLGKGKALLKAAEAWAKAKASFDFHDYSTLDAMKVNKHPILFIHGTADDFVPMHFTEENYEACTAPKQVLYVEGAKHAVSGIVDPEAYFAAIDGFLNA